MTVVKLEIMKGNPICLFIFFLISLLIGTSDNLTFAGYNVYQSQSVMNGMSEFALANVEAVAGCEATDGYPMDKYCIPGNGRCYYADFVVNDCISNLV